MFRMGALAVIVFASSAICSIADVILLEDFEDSTVLYTTSVPEFTDGSQDYFIRTDGSDIGGESFNNIQGSFYFGAQDLDGEGGPATVTLTFENIDISLFTDLSFSGFFAEDDAGDGLEDWDAGDSFLAEYQIDGGGFNNLLAFEDQGGTNTEPLEDTNFDGTGDGTALTDTFTSFSKPITGTGSSLDVRFTIALDSGDEDIAFDDIMIEGTPIPEPATAGLFGVAALAAYAVRRRIRS